MKKNSIDIDGLSDLNDKNKAAKSAFLFLLLMAFVHFLIYLFRKRTFPKVPKHEVIALYKVDKKTFRKWIIHFCQELFPDISTYDRLRKLDYKIVQQIWETIGSPKSYPVLNKKQIVKIGEGTYRSLRQSIEKYLDRFGISKTVFAQLSKFPPKVSQKIVEQNG